MDSDIDELKRSVKENRELIEDNNKMLRKIRKYLALSVGIKILYWVIIFGAAFGAYYLIQPYLDSLKGTYTNVTGGIDKAEQIGDTVKNASSIKNVLSTFGELVD